MKTWLHLTAVFLLVATTAISQPTITSFTPASGPVGTSVTITGTNFNTTTGNNIVIFGATRATVTAATATQLTVTVPTGATYAPITVLNATTTLLAYSKSNFTPTFSPNKGNITSTDFGLQAFPTTGTNPYSVAIGDLDGDGKADLAVANSSSVSVIRNTSSSGTMSYAAKVDIATGTNPFSVAIGDLDGDGRADLAVANYGSNTVSVFRNTGSSGTISYAAKVDFATGANPFAVAIGDLDGNGKADLAVVNNGSSTVSVFRNTGSSGTISYATKVDFATGTDPLSLAIGDLDGDGKADLAVANYNSATVSVLRNIGSSGTISYATKVDFATGVNPRVFIGDLDGDGKADLVVANQTSNTVSVLRNTGSSGTISYAAKVDFTTGSSPTSVAIGDLDGDGKADLAVANFSGNAFSVLRNTGSSGTISYAAKVDFATGTNPYSVAIGDLDGDGKADLAAAMNSSSAVYVYMNIRLIDQAITFGALPTKTFGDVPFTISATTSSTLPVTFTSSNASVAMVSGNTVTIVGGGTAIIMVTQAGNTDYNSATPVDQLLTVNKANQTISFGALSTKVFGDAAFNLTATASSGLPITYTSSSTAVATVSGNTVTIVGGGTTTITAAQVGNDNYAAATNVPQILTVNKINQTITFASLTDKIVGNPAFTLSATSSSGLAIAYSSTSNKVSIVGNQVTIASAGRATITASQPGNASYNAATSLDQSFCIKPAKPMVTLSNGNTPSPTLTSSASVGNQWYRNGVALPGATNTTLAITQAGIYKVQAQVDDCISVFSDDQSIIVTAIEPGSMDNIGIYPNPAVEELTIDLSGFEKGAPVSISTVDLLGRSMNQLVGAGGSSIKMNVRSFTAGRYIITLQQGKSSVAKSFIKLGN